MSATSPAVIASPPASAASTEALVAPGAVRRGERAAGWLVRRGGVRFVADAAGFVAVAAAGLRAGGLRAGLAAAPGGARVERGERLAQPVGLADELVKALLDLFTQTVDHVPLPRWLGAGDRTAAHAAGQATSRDGFRTGRVGLLRLERQTRAQHTHNNKNGRPA